MRVTKERLMTRGWRGMGGEARGLCPLLALRANSPPSILGKMIGIGGVWDGRREIGQGRVVCRRWLASGLADRVVCG